VNKSGGSNGVATPLLSVYRLQLDAYNSDKYGQHLAMTSSKMVDTSMARTWN